MLTAARRAGRSLLVILLVTMGAVALPGLAPGSAVSVILGENATPEAIAALNTKLSMDKPLWSQYLNWLWDAVCGDLGASPVTGQPVVVEAIGERLPMTLELAALALVFVLLVAGALAVVSATWPGTAIDRAITALSSGPLGTRLHCGPRVDLRLCDAAWSAPVTGWSHPRLVVAGVRHGRAEHGREPPADPVKGDPAQPVAPVGGLPADRDGRPNRGRGAVQLPGHGHSAAAAELGRDDLRW
ncbi:exported hypothetical protein [Frankia sp. Hr75.2]|nr:exported hypothetical protein [Frankia sp. Hr75.2]